MSMRPIVLVWLAALPMAPAHPVDTPLRVDLIDAFYNCQADAVAAQRSSISGCFSPEPLWDDEYTIWFDPTASCLATAARVAISTTWLCKEAFDKSRQRIVNLADWDDNNYILKEIRNS
ncbi:hypothetical protein [Nereida ignava]|uniref:hypothetical protein n=1 Tax=Nereida ignava TaxID=282199 RepID=UPI0030F5A3F5